MRPVTRSPVSVPTAQAAQTPPATRHDKCWQVAVRGVAYVAEISLIGGLAAVGGVAGFAGAGPVGAAVGVAVGGGAGGLLAVIGEDVADACIALAEMFPHK